MTGWKLRGYAVEHLLGRGASSEVWRARVAASGEPVALKWLPGTTPEQVRRAHAEAALLTVLDHPNLVRLHAVVPTPEAAVLVLDLADGGSLAGILAARGRLTPGETITALAPIAAALAYVHRRAVVHGDVAPANVLFTRGGVALLADLGVSRLTGDESAAESTPAYVDPGVAGGGVPTTASDVFMLGAVALHALTGEPPWAGADVDAILAAACRADTSTAPARLAAAGVPDAMAAVVARALDPDPLRRGTAAEFALDLRHSATPVAVELQAGREVGRPDAGIAPDEPPQPGQTSPSRRGYAAASLPYAPRHAVPSVAARRVAAVAERAAPHPQAQPQPHARSQVPSQPQSDRLPPTRAVRRSRPELPPRRRWAGRRVRRTILGSAVAGLLAAAAAGAWFVRPFDHQQRSVADRTTRTAGVDRVDRVDWAAQLRAVDRLRARAYAERDPRLLARVYPPGPLRSADAAQLLRLVPEGCSLRGAVTRYANLQFPPQPRTGRPAGVAVRVTVHATARIPAAVLRCPGRPDRSLAPVGPTSLRIGLVLDGTGPRIATQQAST